VQKEKKYSANFTDYLGFLIGLKYETIITKIANKTQQFLAEIIQKKTFRSNCITFSCILLKVIVWFLVQFEKKHTPVSFSKSSNSSRRSDSCNFDSL
jgi:hypothetical protein